MKSLRITAAFIIISILVASNVNSVAAYPSPQLSDDDLVTILNDAASSLGWSSRAPKLFQRSVVTQSVANSKDKTVCRMKQLIIVNKLGGVDPNMGYAAPGKYAWGSVEQTSFHGYNARLANTTETRGEAQYHYQGLAWGVGNFFFQATDEVFLKDGCSGSLDVKPLAEALFDAWSKRQKPTPTPTSSRYPDPKWIDVLNTTANALGWSERGERRVGTNYILAHNPGCSSQIFDIFPIADTSTWDQQHQNKLDSIKTEVIDFHGTKAYRITFKSSQGLYWKFGNTGLDVRIEYGCGGPTDTMPFAEAFYKAAVAHNMWGGVLATPITTPHASPTPNTPAPNPTPTITPTPAPRDLAIAKIAVFNSVEGGKLVSYKPAVARVHLTWPDPLYDGRTKVELLMDGLVLDTQTFIAKNSYKNTEIVDGQNSANFHISQDKLTPGAHTFSARASLESLMSNGKDVTDIQAVDPNPDNNKLSLPSQNLPQTRSLTLRVLSIHKDISPAIMHPYISQARRLLLSLYPVNDVVILPPYVPYIGDIVWDTANGRVVQLEEWRNYYNSQQVLASGAADFFVGLFPRCHYGSAPNPNDCPSGMSYTFYRNAVLVASNDVQALPHEIGHAYLTRWGMTYEEYSKANPGKFLNRTAVYDSHTRQIEDLNTQGGDTKYINFMGATGAGNKVWVDANTWNMLVDRLAFKSSGGLNKITLQDQEAASPGFQISGAISLDGSVTVNNVVWLENVSHITSANQDTLYWVDRVDKDGGYAGSIPLDIEISKNEPTPFMIFVPVAKAGDVSRLNILREGEVVWSTEASQTTPKINVNAPSGNVSGEVNISVSAADSDGSPLTHVTFFSYDNKTWLPIATFNQSSFTLNAAALPGCAQCKLRLLTSDGWNTAIATSSAFSIPNKPPMITLLAPQKDSEFAQGEALTLLANAYDLEDGALTQTLAWTSDKDGALGNGEQFIITKLSAGTHTLTVTARDANNNEAKASVTIKIIGGSSPSLTVTPPTVATPTITPAAFPMSAALLGITAFCLVSLLGSMGLVILLMRNRR